MQQDISPFPKLWHNVERCQQWVNACSREDFTIKNITKDTHICVEHWHGEKRRTTEFPDLLKANLLTSGVAKATQKRKLPMENCLVQDEGIYLDNNKATQMDMTKQELASKIENMILRNKLQSGLSRAPNLCAIYLMNHPDQMKHFVGLTSSQFVTPQISITKTKG